MQPPNVAKSFGFGRSVALLKKVTYRPSFESALPDESSFGPRPPVVRLTRSVVRLAITGSEERKKTRPFDTARLCPSISRFASTPRTGLNGISPVPSRKTRAIAPDASPLLSSSHIFSPGSDSRKASTSFSIATAGKLNGGSLMRTTARPSGVPAMPHPAGAPRFCV